MREISAIFLDSTNNCAVEYAGAIEVDTGSGALSPLIDPTEAVL
jgi:hypothetical protein